ncbi:MAG: phosphatidylglycerophosphatase A [Pseudomonadota bacterium]
MTSEPDLTWRDLRNPDVLVASAFGVGMLKPAPGTWASAFALLVWWYVVPPLLWWEGLILATGVALFGWWLCERICQRWGIGDAGALVIDEVAGMFYVLALAPAGLLWGLAAFVLFRALDIWKPGPIGWCDRQVKGGLGVMLDDCVAGLAGGGVLWITAIALA